MKMAVPLAPLRGKLEEISFPVLLRALLRDRRDGCLTVTRGAVTRRLFLRGGMIIYGSSTERQDRLGEILIAQGKLSRADHKKYWEESQSGNRLLGITLVLNGRITQSDLYQGVTAQVVTILERLQKWRKGEYEFEEGREPDAGTVLLRIPLALYLQPDTVKKPAKKKAAAGKPAAKKVAKQGPEKKSAAKKSAAKKSAEAVAPVPLEPAAAADAAPPPGVGGDDEPVFEIFAEEPAPEAISAEAAREMECVGEVSFLVQELRKRIGQDAYTLLGVPQGAERSVVQAAYHRIAKVIHPDRFPKGCGPELVIEAGEVFLEVTAAAQSLDGERKASEAPAAAPPPPPGGREVQQTPAGDGQARRFFALGREWISKRNYWQAADALRQAVRLNPEEATYRQYLGLALMQTKRLHEAEEHLVVATRLEPHNPAHYVNLGRIYRAGRLYRKAREAFERALRLDPRSDHAREELSDLPEEVPPARKAESVGILKKLFGKG